MTRPAQRMCARCERTTYDPVLVHEVHAPTGPGFNVYACQECAVHYPPMTDVLELLESTHRRSRITLHVYKIDTEGAVTEDRGEVEILAGGRNEAGAVQVDVATVRLPKVHDTAVAKQNSAVRQLRTQPPRRPGPSPVWG